MIQITLVCAGGLSTSLMVNKMKKAAELHGIETNIVAMSADEFLEEEYQTDILLIAPQLSWREEELKGAFHNQIKWIQSIEMVDYGMMNGEKVLMDVLKHYQI